MKASRFFLALFLIISFVACSKDDVDSDGNLQGRWNVEKVAGQQFTNGNPGIKLEDNNPIGYIEFGAMERVNKIIPSPCSELLIQILIILDTQQHKRRLSSKDLDKLT